ncbi:hypothetical protein O9929_06500 [Vibrio lentus]|nr:hypothetical protein [Vibrio lentus]
MALKLPNVVRLQNIEFVKIVSTSGDLNKMAVKGLRVKGTKADRLQAVNRE